MLNSWGILGQFMYPASAYRRLIELVRSGQINLSAIQPRIYPFTDLPEAMQAAAVAGSTECVVAKP